MFEKLVLPMRKYVALIQKKVDTVVCKCKQRATSHTVVELTLINYGVQSKLMETLCNISAGGLNLLVSSILVKQQSNVIWD